MRWLIIVCVVVTLLPFGVLCTEDTHATPPEVVEEEEREVRFTIVLCGMCLTITFLVGYVLDSRHIHWLPEAGVGIAVGAVAGLGVKHLHSVDKMRELVRFDPEFFFIFLLPPIIFEAGYNMKRQQFFRNIVPICLYAFVGTTVSTFIVAGIVLWAGRAGWCHAIGGLGSLVFGSLISATDPVTVLAVFQRVHANVDLYSLVFGESVLNDAVAIVLYRTVVGFSGPITVGSIMGALGNFAAIFMCSLLVGTLFAVVSALLFKHSGMAKTEEFLFVELCLMCCFPYMAFMVAEGLQLSGIVSVLFCGIVMAHYTYNNLSHGAQTSSRQLFKVLASLAETFVFVYLGLAMFAFEQTWAQAKLVLVALISILIARVFNIYPLSLLWNWWKPHQRISPRFQFLLWFSGLRGAVAFVIAVSFKQDYYNNPDGASILSVTLFIAVITVFFMGGSITSLVRRMDALEHDVEVDSSSYPQEGEAALMRRGVTKAVEEAKGVLSLDRRYLKPFFTNLQYRPFPRDVPDSPRSVELETFSPQLDIEED